MDNIIARATDSINQAFESSFQLNSYRIYSQLADTRNLLNRLLQPDSPRNSWTRLFCRQLNRLMNYNDSLSHEFWIELHDDILYILKGSIGKQGMGSSWNRFHKRINFEEKLEQRELQFKQKIKEHKSLNQLFCEHKEFFKQYLQKCISLHSKMQVQGLVENIDHLLFEVYRLREDTLTLESRKRLKELLKCIEVTLNFSNRALESLDSQFSTNDNSYKIVNNSLSSFLPSIEQIEINRSDQPEKIENVLLCNRWIVILGDPGSAKTTLLRWITRIFAKTARNVHEEVVLKENGCIPVRIPILIRIGEFAAWVDQYPTKTLIDYIGEHTWFSERYCHDDNKSALRELIDHGHALILLDGLDEISEVGRRGEIVHLVRKFIDEYVHAPDFFSAFDNTIFKTRMLDSIEKVVETQPPSKCGGNQIVVTSRIVGYQLYPLTGPFIHHYALLLMNHREANEFVKKWMSQVEKGLLDVLLNEGIKLGREMVETLSKKRSNAVESMFDIDSEFLMSNPSLLSLICTFIFQSSDEFHPKSRVEVYNHAVQAALCFWTTQEPNISEDLLTNFLINLSTYLQLNSPSGLIDEFDIKRLCCLTLQQQYVSNDRVKLREHANKLISLLDSNIGIVAERGLQVFGFLHLSFQEYFVAQSFVKGSSVEEIARRILTFIIHPRFRESLLLALGWISWKWSFDDYDKFCNLLVTPTENYAIPLGTLLFFDAFNDIQRLPSKSIIFIALNNLLHHPSNVIRRTYLIPNLFQLNKNIIREWMQLHLTDDQYLFKFCQYFSTQQKRYPHRTQIDRKSILHVVYQQLWSFHHRSSSTEFVIDQTLRRTMISGDVPDQIFNKDFSLYLLSHDICVSNIHPLIASAIITVCGGICLKSEEKIIKLQFSSKQMHRETSILAPIVEYLENHNESHLTKVHTLVKQYESVLEKSLPADTSLDVVDTFIALICLQGVSQPLIYEKYDGYQALPLALDRFKRTWFYFKESCDRVRSDFHSLPNMSFINSEVKLIMNVFFSQSDQFDEQNKSFSVACAAAWKKLGIWHHLNDFDHEIFRSHKTNRYFQYQSDFTHLINEEKLDEVAKDIHLLPMLQEKPLLLLIFVPQSLQQLYNCMIVPPTNNTDSLPLVVFLSQCLTHLEDVDKDDLNFHLALPMLQPLLKEHMLENYALVLFRETFSHTRVLTKDHEMFLKAMEDRKLLEPFLIDQPKDWERLISMERQRICEVKAALQNEEKDVRLFAASISLARLFQARYRSRKYRAMEHISLSNAESKEVHFAIINILNPVLQIIALIILLDMKDPLIFNEEQRNKLRLEMIILLQSLLPRLSLLTSTLLFVRCHSARQMFPVSFQDMANVIVEKFNETSIDKQYREQQAVYIALRQLKNSDLSHCLTQFEKRTINLSELLQFNSTIFYRYFTNTTSFDSSNPILLSLMYLAELTFDAQILNMYTINTQKIRISPLTELKQLWDESSKYSKIMTFKVSTWITNYFQVSNKEELHQIIEDVSQCLMIERKSLSVIDKWLDYRMDKVLNFFAHYAALQLIIEGSDIPGLIDIINEMFLIDNRFHLKFIVGHLFSSRLVNSPVVRQVLVTLHYNVRYSSKVSIWTSCKEMLKLFLNLELERVISNAHQLYKISAKPFLSMISGFSEDLELYLVEHVRIYVNVQSELENVIKDEYLAVIVKWIILSSIPNEKRENFSIEFYEYIFTLLHNQQFPRVQKAIVNALNSVFIESSSRQKNVFLQGDVITNLEKVICSWNTYSEDVVTACLLTYGNCLLRLKMFQECRKVSNETKNTLTILFETSFSEIISIRAGFCLIFVEPSSIKFDTISSWFIKKMDLTVEKRYKISLQQTLYEARKWTMNDENENENETEIIDHIEKHFSELIDKFVIDLYNYLCNKDKNNYLSDPEPNYVQIALKVSEKNFNEFRTAVQKSSFGEKKLKREVYLHYKNNPTDNEALIKLYAHFGIVTVELVEMLNCFLDDESRSGLYLQSRLKEVSDRDVIEQLFQLLYFETYNNKFETILLIFQSLAESHAVSLLEVHQKVSLINKMSYDDSDGWWKIEKSIVDLLLNLSCINKEFSPYFNEKLFSKSDIDEQFERKLVDVGNMSSLFLRRNNFLDDFGIVLNS